MTTTWTIAIDWDEMEHTQMRQVMSCLHSGFSVFSNRV